MICIKTLNLLPEVFLIFFYSCLMNNPESLKSIVDQFDIEGQPFEFQKIPNGFINSTYIVKTIGEYPDYILQKKNKEIFKDVPSMMDNIHKVTSHLRDKIDREGRDIDRQVMKVVSTHNGELFYKDADGEYWTMSRYIPDTITYEIASNLDLAKKGGEGLGKFLFYLHDFNQKLHPTIEGFHDLKFRFKQWDETLKRDPIGRASEVAEEINKIELRRKRKEEFWSKVESGEIPQRVTHNDTKLSNILFNQNNEVECIIDLDTVMTNTALADFGDAIRSFANTSKEDEKVLSKISLDKEMFKAYTEGYLSQTVNILNKTELEHLSFAPLYITYEQVMRFLMDYIDGDKYYKIDYPEHNLVRTRAQMKLLESLEENFEYMKDTVNEIINQYKKK